jgi:hypothetical protein
MAHHRLADVPAIKNRAVQKALLRSSQGRALFIGRLPFSLTHLWCSATIERRRAPPFRLADDSRDKGLQCHLVGGYPGGAMYRAIYRSVAACLAVLPSIGAFSGQKSSSKSPVRKTPASVKLWVDSNSENSCEQVTPASGGWMIRNNEGRNVLVTIHRATTKDGVAKEDEMRDTLGPRESRELGCEISEDGQQTLTLVRATF